MENKSMNIIIDINEKYYSINLHWMCLWAKKLTTKWISKFLKFTENGFEHKIPDFAFPYVGDYWQNKDKFKDSSIIQDKNMKRSKNKHAWFDLSSYMYATCIRTKGMSRINKNQQIS